MHRLGILSIYDENGIIDASLKWYIQELHSVVDDLIIVSNCTIQKEDYCWLSVQSCKIIQRDNVGYDAAAYKEVLEKLSCPLDYDEIVLSNDTFWGPFIPFCEIFSEMETKSYDFWGLNRRHIPLYDFITSFFLVFHKKTIPAVLDYFRNTISNNLCRDDVLILFEQGISEHLKNLGFGMGSYCDIWAVDLYKEPDYLIKILGSPVMKKRCYEKNYYIEDNCRRALKYIRENSDYDIMLIKNEAKRKYDIQFADDYEWIDERSEVYNRIFYYGAQESELEAYLKKNPEIYLYGNGNTAKDFIKRYSEQVTVRGYIVSDIFNDCMHDEGKNITVLSSVENKNLPIIVALSKANTREVALNLEKFTNVFYLWRWK